MNRTKSPRLLRKLALWSGVAALLAACTSPQPPKQAKLPDPEPEPMALPKYEPVQPLYTGKVSQARTARDYRRDAAAHLYANNTSRIYQGKMPPLLHAVGVLEVDIDARGAVTNIRWARAPKHAPEVMAEIESSVRKAAPFPAPVRMSRVTYTDTWLWHKSGKFQLDTLTEGQH